MSDLKRVHLSAGECPGAQTVEAINFSPDNFATLSYFKNSFKTDSAVNF